MVFNFLACLIQEKNQYEFLFVSLKILTNSRNCSESRIKFLCWLSFALIGLFFSGDAEEALNAPQNKHLRIENKNFYFDIKRNQQGRYMSISEVPYHYVTDYTSFNGLF